MREGIEYREVLDEEDEDFEPFPSPLSLSQVSGPLCLSIP